MKDISKKKMDLRTQKVYTSLIDAFKSLLEEKSFEEITVNELCDRACTRRATFYKHFSDKYDFFIFMIKYMQSTYASKIDTVSEPFNLKKYYFSILTTAFEFVEENRPFIDSLRKSSMLFTYMNTSFSELFSDFQVHIEAELKAMTNLNIHYEIVTAMILGGISMIINWWLINDTTISKDDILNEITALADTFFNQLRNEIQSSDI